MKPISQTDQIIEVLRNEGGYATFKRLTLGVCTIYPAVKS